jgi:hypothetical protein
MSKLKNRMAGKKLDERFGKGFTDRVKGDGMQERTNQGYSKRELLAEFRGRPDGVSIDEGEGNLVDKYQGLVDSGKRFNNQAEDYLKSHGVIFNRPEESVIKDEPEEIDFVNDEPIAEYPSEVPSFSSAPVQTIITSPNPDESDFVPGLSGDGFDFDQTLNVNQDNDISNLVYGSNNNMTNYQDNSISNIASIGDGLYAQRNPMDFKNTFMQNLFN